MEVERLKELYAQALQDIQAGGSGSVRVGRYATVIEASGNSSTGAAVYMPGTGGDVQHRSCAGVSGKVGR